MWGDNKLPPRLGFCFKPPSAYVPGRDVLRSRASTVGTGGFFLAAPELVEICTSQQGLRTSRGMQEKAMGSFPR